MTEQNENSQSNDFIYKNRTKLPAAYNLTMLARHNLQTSLLQIILLSKITDNGRKWDTTIILHHLSSDRCYRKAQINNETFN